MGSTQFLSARKFALSGMLVQWQTRPGKPQKSFWLATTDGKYLIKLSKIARLGLTRFPQVGEQVQVRGHYRFDQQTGERKFKAHELRILGAVQPTPTKALAKILVCQQSACRHRGAGAVQQALETALAEGGLSEQVKLQGTGCMGHCKQGPCIAFLPGKARFQQVKPAEVAALVGEHFPTTPTQPS